MWTHPHKGLFHSDINYNISKNKKVNKRGQTNNSKSVKVDMFSLNSKLVNKCLK